MNVATVKVDKELATQKYKEYLEAVKTRKAKEYNALRRTYRALSKGYKVIDIYKAFEDTDVGEDGRPKLAIVRADAKQVYFTKLAGGAGRFSRHRPNTWQRHEMVSDVNLPAGIFKEWQPINPNKPITNWGNIKDTESVTNVPIVPASVTMPNAPENYYILFEVDKWSKIAPVRDPYLLQRINNNSFIVLAEWDVTEVEAIVMRGR